MRSASARRRSSMALCACQREPPHELAAARLQVARHRSGLARLSEVADGAVVRRIDELILIAAGRRGAPRCATRRNRHGGAADPRAAGRASPRSSTCAVDGLIDQLRRAIEILRIDRGLDLGRPELVPHLGDALIERRQSRIARDRCCARSRAPATPPRIASHPGPIARAPTQDLRETLQSLLRFTVTGSEQQARCDRGTSALPSAGSMKCRSRMRDLRLLDERVDFLLGSPRPSSRPRAASLPSPSGRRAAQASRRTRVRGGRQGAARRRAPQEPSAAGTWARRRRRARNRLTLANAPAGLPAATP